MDDIDLLAGILLATHFTLGFVATVLISANRTPAAAIAWVLLIIFVPVIGAIVFVLVGFGRLPLARREKQRQVNEKFLAITPGLTHTGHRAEWPPWLSSAVRLNSTLGALPMVGGNRAELLDNYDGSIQAMADAVDTATDYVNVQFYILVLDSTTQPFFDALRRATARGVSVRVLSDHVAGFLSPRRRETLAALSGMGAVWHAMLPLRPLRGQWQRADFRNHRKLVVVDGRIGFTGSQNMIDSSYLKRKNRSRGLRWIELMVRLEGPAVREINAVFVTDWFSETEEMLDLDPTPIVLDETEELLDMQVVPSGPSFENDNNLKLFALLLHQARRRISITSPYFVPEASVLLAIVTAASRGVDVELFVSAVGDQALVYHAQRSYYEVLLRAGVSIYLYRAPAVLHSKHFSIDDSVAVIGSSNMDIRSFSLNMEISVLVHGENLVGRMRRVEDSYRANSDRLELSAWLRRPVREKVGDNLARLTSSLQ